MSDSYTKQYDNGHKIQRLYVHWDVSTQCNFKCSYCYAMKSYGDRWDKIDTWTRQRLVIRNIANSTLPVFLGLLGGEPTMHPQYNELISLSHAAVTNKPDGRIYITTNGSNPTEWFEAHPFYDRMYFLWSIHFEYEMKYGKGFSRFLDNVKCMRDKGFPGKVNVMLLPQKKLWPKIHALVDELEKIDGIEIHPHFLYQGHDVHQIIDYTSDFYREFARFKEYPKPFVFETANDVEYYNDYTLFSADKSRFKGWKCWNNNYEISYDGRVARFCAHESQNLIEKINFFRDIKEVRPITCEWDACNCDGLLKIYKENPNGQDGRVGNNNEVQLQVPVLHKLG